LGSDNKGKIMKIEKSDVVLSIVAALMIGGTAYGIKAISDAGDARDARQLIERQPKEMPIAWCVKVCREDIFDDMHSTGESWGTSSSSMNGMAQNDTLTTTIKYCQSIYKDSCIKVHRWDGKTSYIHGDGYDKATTKDAI
jgi:hypothetical protein